jgi:MFS family permease
VTSSPRSGALGFWSELPHDGRWLLSTVVVQFFGRGLTLPFTIIYLHEVRGFSLGLSGTLMGLIAVVGLLVTGPAGALVDRYGARRVMLTGLVFAIAGYSVLAFATVPAVAALGLALFGVQLGVGWPSVNALVATVVEGDLRQRYYGVNFALLNLGVGVGGVVGGLVVDVERPGTFVMAFLVNATTFLLPVVVLLGPLRHLHGRVDRPADHDGAAEGYLTILRRPEVLWLSGLGLLAAFVGYGQMEGGFPAFARLVAEVSTRTIGFAFVVNTVVIVALQFWVMNRVRGRRRTRVLALMAVVWAAAWLLLGGAGLVPGGTAAVVIVLVFHGLFGLGGDPHAVRAARPDERHGARAPARPVQRDQLRGVPGRHHRGTRGRGPAARARLGRRLHRGGGGRLCRDRGGHAGARAAGDPGGRRNGTGRGGVETGLMPHVPK